ncbi:GDP-mannose 4,6-dehydratase [Candidatus Omnitrophota bacterium]
MKDKFWRNKSVLVSGANGFLASHLTLALLRQGARVTGIIKESLPTSFLELELKEKKFKNLRLIKGDIADYSFIKRAFLISKPDLCFHLAAQAIVGLANKSPLPTFETNITGTWNILEVLRQISPRTKVIVASSDKAYGEHKKLPYKENAALQSLHPYDASKACTDILTRTYSNTYNLATAVTRCANIYGPGDLNFSRIIPDTIKSAVFNRNPVIRSDGTPMRDYIYIEDALGAYLRLAKALNSKGRGVCGEAFNFGSGRPVSVINLVNIILKLSHKKKLKPVILSRRKIKGEIDRQYLSSSKAKRLLRWSCSYSLSKGLKETIIWYKAYLSK